MHEDISFLPVTYKMCILTHLCELELLSLRLCTGGEGEGRGRGKRRDGLRSQVTRWLCHCC